MQGSYGGRRESFEFRDGEGQSHGSDKPGETGDGEENVVQECGAAAGDAGVKQGARQAGNGRMRGSCNRRDGLDRRRERIRIDRMKYRRDERSVSVLELSMLTHRQEKHTAIADWQSQQANQPPLPSPAKEQPQEATRADPGYN